MVPVQFSPQLGKIRGHSTTPTPRQMGSILEPVITGRGVLNQGRPAFSGLDNNTRLRDLLSRGASFWGAGVPGAPLPHWSQRRFHFSGKGAAASQEFPRDRIPSLGECRPPPKGGAYSQLPATGPWIIVRRTDSASPSTCAGESNFAHLGLEEREISRTWRTSGFRLSPKWDPVKPKWALPLPNGCYWQLGGNSRRMIFRPLP